MIEQIWRDLLSSDDLPEHFVRQDDLDDIISLIVNSRIDPQKFAANLRVLLTGGRALQESFGFRDPDALAATSSIGRFASVLDRPMGAPLWLIAAFPDVLTWLDEKLRESAHLPEEKQQRVLAQLFGVDLDSGQRMDEDSLERPDGSMPVQYDANLVSNYVRETGKSLEVAVEKGSENDIYLGMELLQASGEQSNFTLIASMTAKYYSELKRRYSSCFADETSLLAMAGMLDASLYILGQAIAPEQIIELAKRTESGQDRLLDFIVHFEVLLLSLDSPGLSLEEVQSACEDQATAISGAIQRVIESDTREPEIASAVEAGMSSPRFARWRRLAGVRRPSWLRRLKGAIFG